MAVPTFSGNEITDVTRRLNVEGDGYLPEQRSVGIWSGTTNLFPNGGIETDATNWQNTNSGNTVARSTLRSKFGIASLLVDNDGSVSYQGAQSGGVTISTSTTYTWSFWICPNSGVLTPVISVIELLTGVEVNNPIFATPTVCPPGVWTRISGTWTSAGAGINQTLLRVYGVNGTGVANFNLDGIQLEARANPTPYVETNGASAIRIASDVSAPSTPLDQVQGWAAVRLRTGYPSTYGANPVVWEWAAPAYAQYLQFYFQQAGDTWSFDQQGNGGGNIRASSAAQSFDYGTIFTIIGKWTAALIGISANGVPFVTNGITNSCTTLAAKPTFTICSTPLDLPAIGQAEVFWAAAGTGTLTDADAKRVAAFNNDPLMSDFPGTPTWFWDNQAPVFPGSHRARSRGTSW